MNQWLADYEYRTTISWDIYLASALAVIFISLGTISSQTNKRFLETNYPRGRALGEFFPIKAGLVNPVKNLRDQ